MSIAGFDVSGPVVILGVITGMIYGILAVGLVLVHRANRIINFAHGEIGAFGASLLGVAVLDWDLPYWVAFALALVVGAAMGAASEVLVVRRLRNAPVILSVVATLGLGQFLTVFSAVVNPSGGAGNVYPQPSGMPDFDIGALRVTPAYSTMLLLTPVIVLALALFLRRGRLGIAMRASAANPDAARMAGILTDRMSLLAWAVAGAISAYTAVLILPTRGFTNTQILGPGLLLRGLACAVIARMVSLPVALGVGIALGTLEQLLFANYPTGGLVEAIIFVAILGALLLQRARTGRSEDKGSWAVVQAWPALPDSFQRVFAIRNLGRLITLAGFIVALGLQVVVTNATAVTLVVLASFTTVGLSVGVVTGLGGQLSLGQFALGGVGATMSYVVTARGWGFVPGLAAAGLAAGVVSLLIGLPALRIRGLMLAVTTLSFALAAQSWLLEQSWMLGGGVNPGRPSFAGVDFAGSRSYYLVALGVLVVAGWLARNVWTSGAGRRLRAVRDNEDAARAFTVPATTVKLQGFVLGGFIAGLGGAVYGHLLAQLGSNAFPIDASINVAAVAVIGGIGILAGPLFGALYIIGVPEFLPLDNAGLAATSLGWLLLILYVPGGIAQALRPVRDAIVDALARQAGLDPKVERTATPAGGDSLSTSVALPAPPPRNLAKGEVVLSAKDLVKHFGGVKAVDGVSLDVHAGETVGLIGPNGAGKTTTFELLAGFTRADTGTVTFDGSDVSDLSPERRAGLGLIRSFQDAALFPTMPVLEVVMLALERVDPTSFASSVLGRHGADRRKEARARDLVGMMGLHSYRNSTIRELSTGTRRITELACLIALEPVVLLLDEPTSGIAQRETEALGTLLRRLKDDLDLTLVIIEHDIPMIMSLSDRVVAMESGRVIADGPPAAVREDPAVVTSYLGGDVRAIERSVAVTA